MAKIKPKFGVSNSGWTERVLFGDQKQRLLDIHNDDEFIKTMEGIASRYKINRDYEKQALNAAEIEATLKVIADEAATLREHLSSLDRNTRMLLKDSAGKLKINYGLIDDMQKELSSLNIISSNALLNMDRESFRKTRGSHLSLAAEIKYLLDKYDIPTTNYDKGPWCECIEIVLDACNDYPSDPRNIIRSFLG